MIIEKVVDTGNEIFVGLKFLLRNLIKKIFCEIFSNIDILIKKKNSTAGIKDILPSKNLDQKG
jgi:hypothetical protein